MQRECGHSCVTVDSFCMRTTVQYFSLYLVCALSQEVLRSQAPAQASLQVLQQLGDQLKQQVDTSAASAIQSDHLSLTQRLAAVEQALTRQLTALQVEKRLCN